MSKPILSALALAGCGLSLAAHADVEVAPNTVIGSQVFFDFGNISNKQNSNLPNETNIAPTGNALTAAFVAYATPLIGDPLPPFQRL